MCANHMSGDRAILMVFCIRRKAAQPDCRSSHRAETEAPTSSRTAHPPLFGHSSRPHQNQQRRSRRSRLSHRQAGQSVECLNGCREDRERRVFRFPRRWSSQAIVRCNRLRAITLARLGAAVGRPVDALETWLAAARSIAGAKSRHRTGKA